MKRSIMPELPGTDYDPNCLHCVLSPLVESFCQEHQQKGPEQCIRELARLLGEFIGSGVHHSGLPEQQAIKLLERLSMIATHELVDSAANLRDRLKTHSQHRPS